jgi:hypothetical protein
MENKGNGRRIYLFCLINPGPIFRESGNGKIVGIPGNRQWKIPGMKNYPQPWGQTVAQRHRRQKKSVAKNVPKNEQYNFYCCLLNCPFRASFPPIYRKSSAISALFVLFFGNLGMNKLAPENIIWQRDDVHKT